MIVRFEDLTGKNQLEHWLKLLEFLQIPSSEKDIETILTTYNFEFWTKGRKKGEEDQKSHMRKGIIGDWKNYFTPKTTEAFNQISGEIKLL